MHNQDEAKPPNTSTGSFNAFLLFALVPVLFVALFLAGILWVLKLDPSVVLGKNPLAAIVGMFACSVCLGLSSVLALQLAWLYRNHPPSAPPLEFGYRQQVYGLSGERKNFVTEPVALAGSALAFAALAILILRIAIVNEVAPEKEKGLEAGKLQNPATAITIENGSASSIATPNPASSDAKPKQNGTVKPKVNCAPCTPAATP